MGLIASRANEEAIIKYWRLLNTLNLALIPLVFFVWIFTPSFTKNLKSTPQLILRIVSIVFSVSGSGVILVSTNELTKLKPQIDSLNKRDNAEFKHTVASILLDAQKTNEMIVDAAISQRRAELNPYEVSSEPLSYKELGELEPSELQSYEVNRDQGNSELDVTNEPYFEAVIEALDDGIFESKIIKEIMGFKGVNYAKGKKVLDKIKGIYEQESESV
jgi:hypothetical protein